MGSIGVTSFRFSLKISKQNHYTNSVVTGCLPERVEENGCLGRRTAMVSGVSLVSSAMIGFPKEGLAVIKQGLLAGRVPGLSEPNEQGWFLSISYILTLTCE